jgi:hypothetical protein
MKLALFLNQGIELLGIIGDLPLVLDDDEN